METESKTVNVVIAPQTILMTLGLIGALWLAFLIHEILVLVFVSWLVAATLYPAVKWLEQREWPRGISILTFYLLFLGLLGTVGFLLSDMLIVQFNRLAEELPILLDQLSSYVAGFPFVPWDFQLQKVLVDNLEALTVQARDVVMTTLGFFLIIFRRFLDIIAILVLTFLMLLKPNQLERACLALLPHEARPRATGFLETMSLKLGGYIRGQLLIASILGTAVFVGLSLLGVDYALLLSLTAFLLNLVPILGSLLAAIFSMTIALAQDPMLALWTGVLFLVLNQLEANLLGPIILGRSVGLSPFWVIISVMIGGSLYGIPGAFLAIPIVAIIKMLIDEFYVGDYLEQRNNGNNGNTKAVSDE